jgi:hypothetical protein
MSKLNAQAYKHTRASIRLGASKHKHTSIAKRARLAYAYKNKHTSIRASMPLQAQECEHTSKRTSIQAYKSKHTSIQAYKHTSKHTSILYEQTHKHTSIYIQDPGYKSNHMHTSSLKVKGTQVSEA